MSEVYTHGLVTLCHESDTFSLKIHASEFSSHFVTVSIDLETARNFYLLNNSSSLLDIELDRVPTCLYSKAEVAVFRERLFSYLTRKTA